MRYFDSHAHLNLPEFADDLAGVISRARTAGVTRMVNVGIDPVTARLALELAEEHEGLYAAAAVHPNYAKECGDEGFAEVESMLRDGGFLAVGETGLDYYREYSPFDLQREFFRRHLALAEELNLPVIVHCRDAEDDCLGILREEGERRDVDGRVVMHCFGGNAEHAKGFVDAGAYVSFAGVVTFKNAHGTREAAAAVPLDRTLIETDCPFLAPQPRRGKRNEPSWVVWVAEEIARIHGITTAEAARVTTENACRLFGLPAEEGNGETE
jgi:TatD DNase family protein